MSARMVQHWAGPRRERMLARYEISLESVRQPELREVFLAAGVGLRARTVEMFEDLGATDPQRKGRDFVAFLDGLIYDQLAGAGGARTLDEVRRSVRDALAGLVA